jgi:hypothetical protein
MWNQNATAASLAVFVGCSADLHTEHTPAGALAFRVTIKDARKVYGRTDYLVTPVSGSGEQWVSAERVSNLSTPA